jgi:site-specific recombinase XerD
MAHRGKDEDRAEGYAATTVRRRATNLDAFYRWVWSERDGYTTKITHDDGHAYIDELVYRDVSGTHKSNLQKTLRMYYRWRAFEYNDEPWSSDVVFTTQQHDNPRDYLTRNERRAIREASLEYGSVPHYCSLDPDERRSWKIQLARRFGKPTNEIGRSDFERANGHKIPSLVCVSLDAGLRPIEIERARTSWVDTENDLLRIPAKDSAKNRDNWTVGLQARTSAILERWLDERSLYDKYVDTDRLWLTRENNPYQSTSLKGILKRLCEVAGIKTEDRQLTWYAIRHSLGTYMTREEDLAATKAQLRHRSVQTTMKYDQAPVEDRRNALRRME